MMKTLLYRILCCLCLAGLALGCNPAAKGPAPIQEKVTLKFSVPSEYRYFFDDAIEQFKQQEPNITIEINSISYGGPDGDVNLVRWIDIVQSDAQADRTPLDLTPFLQEDQNFNPEDFLPGALETFQSEGKQFALPTGIDSYVIFYNQDLFDRMGVPYPQAGWTWDQFRTTAMQLSDPQAGTFGYLPSEFYLDSMFFVFQNGGSIIDAQGQPHLDSPETIEAIEWYATLFGEGGGAATEQQLSEAFDMGGGDVGVVTSKIGMWFGSLSSLSTDWKGMIKFKLGIAPLPRGRQAYNLAQFEGLEIQSGTSNPQAAWRWVAFLSNQPFTWVYPTRKSIAESTVFLNLFGKEKAAAVASSLEGSAALTGLDFGRFRGTMFAYFSAVREIVNQGAPADEALRFAQDNIPAQ
jgi:multiple sugar transport system substrate-binding protein